MPVWSKERVRKLFSPFYRESDFLDLLTVDSSIAAEKISNQFFSTYILEPNKIFMTVTLDGTSLGTEMYYGVHETHVSGLHYYASDPFVEIVPSVFPSLPYLRHNDIFIFGRDTFGYALSQALHRLACWHTHKNLVNGNHTVEEIRENTMNPDPRVRLLAFASPLCTEEMKIMSLLYYGDPYRALAPSSRLDV